MAFQDVPIRPEPMGKIITGLAVSKTAAMALQVAPGVVDAYWEVVLYTLESAQSHVFTSHATYAKRAQISLIGNDITTDIWVDAYLLDGLKEAADPPAGYRIIQDLVWFEIAAGETDLDNSTIYRRTWV